MIEKPLLDLKSVRVDMVYKANLNYDLDMAVTVTHLPSGVSATSSGRRGQLRMRDEAIVKIVENEVYQQWLTENE